MKYLYILILLFLVIINQSECQEFFSTTSTTNETKKGFNSSRLFFGGDLGFQFGSYTIINFSPLIGYRLTERWAIGTQIKYNFIQIKALNVSTSIYGTSVFATYNLNKNFFLRNEFEWLSLESKYFNYIIYPEHERFSLYNIYLGGGYRTPIGQRSYLNLMLLWNINDSHLNPYENPIIRVNVEI